MLALVIDDSRTMRMILKRLLDELGFTVLQAGDGQEGLDQLDAGHLPDLILVDWNMPVMNGLTFVQTVREHPYSSTADIMMVTTETDVESITAALAAGADEYLIKPFTNDSVATKLMALGFDL
jgi:two-component system chemotaxis response regulator CheY